MGLLGKVGNKSGRVSVEKKKSSNTRKGGGEGRRTRRKKEGGRGGDGSGGKTMLKNRIHTSMIPRMCMVMVRTVRDRDSA